MDVVSRAATCLKRAALDHLNLLVVLSIDDEHALLCTVTGLRLW